MAGIGNMINNTISVMAEINSKLCFSSFDKESLQK